jgi:hypothetical protein
MTVPLCVFVVALCTDYAAGENLPRQEARKTVNELVDRDKWAQYQRHWKPLELVGAAELVLDYSHKSSRFTAGKLTLAKRRELRHAADRLASFALSSSGEVPKRLAGRARILRVVSGNAPAGVTKKLVDKFPNNAFVLNMRALGLWTLGRRVEATKLAERALSQPKADAFVQGRARRIAAALSALDLDKGLTNRQMLRYLGFLASHGYRVRQISMLSGMAAIFEEFREKHAPRVPRYLAMLVQSEPVGFKQFTLLGLLEKIVRGPTFSVGEKEKREAIKRYGKVASMQAGAVITTIAEGDEAGVHERIHKPQQWWKHRDAYKEARDLMTPGKWAETWAFGSKH